MADTKAGFCAQCRKGEHAMCIAPRCTCTERRHQNRPLRHDDEPVRRPAAVRAAPDPQPEPDPPAVEVDWADPPPKRASRPIASPEVVAALEANPGHWAKVGTYLGKTIGNTQQSRFKKGTFAPVTPPEWECAARSIGSTGSAVYLRYVGGGDAA